MNGPMSRPRTSRVLWLVVVLALLGLAAPGVAAASKRSELIRDCEDDSKLRGTYTNEQLKDARDNLKSDTDAYSECRDVLRAAIAANARPRATQGGASGSTGAGAGVSGGAAGSAGAGSGGGATPSTPGGFGGTPAGSSGAGSLDTAAGAPPLAKTPEEESTLRTAREQLPEVRVRGQRVVPGVRGVAGQAASATVPTSLVVVLVLLGLTAVAVGVPFVRRRVIARRSA